MKNHVTLAAMLMMTTMMMVVMTSSYGVKPCKLRRSPVGGQCFAIFVHCVENAVCDLNTKTCRIPAGNSGCGTDDTNCLDDAICESDTCKIPVGSSGCGNASAFCVTNSICESDVCITDPCVPGQHTEVDDVSRSVDNGEGGNCDDTRFGWHRFMLNGVNARIPTSCAPVAGGLRCGGVGSLWVNLKGQSLPTAGQQLDAAVCDSFLERCCFSGPVIGITVRNCGQFFIYNLQGYIACPAVYCVEPQP